MRRRTARFVHREEVKHTNERSMQHPQVIRQIDEADNQEEEMAAPTLTIGTFVVPELPEFCDCGEWLNFEEQFDGMCCSCKDAMDMYGTCEVCGEPIDYCLGGHPYEIEED